MTKMRYVALLRGINVGGNKQIKMADLRDMLSSLGFENTKTVLASGNVVLEAESSTIDALQDTIERGIEATFGFTVSVIVIRHEYLKNLVENNPFEGIDVTKDTRLYVTFLREPSDTQIEIPYRSPENDFTILRVSATEVCSVLTLSPKSKTTDSMKILEIEFGKTITTRNWNTVVKLANL